LAISEQLAIKAGGACTLVYTMPAMSATTIVLR
jgi:hypothetical protein